MKKILLALAAMGFIVVALYGVSLYRGKRIIDAQTDWHRYACVRTATVIRVPTFDAIPGGHGKGYNDQYADTQDWRFDAIGRPARFVRDATGACTRQLSGFMTAEQEAAGRRRPQFDAAGNLLVPEARFTAFVDDIDRRSVQLCWNRPDGTRERCRTFDVGALEAR